MNLEAPVSKVKGIGDKKARLLAIWAFTQLPTCCITCRAAMNPQAAAQIYLN